MNSTYTTPITVCGLYLPYESRRRKSIIYDYVPSLRINGLRVKAVLDTKTLNEKLIHILIVDSHEPVNIFVPKNYRTFIYRRNGTETIIHVVKNKDGY